MSVSTGIVVTRSGDQDNSFGHDVVAQFRRHSRAVTLAGVVLALLGIVPGMPVIPFLPVGAAAAVLGWQLTKKDDAAAALPEAPVPAQPAELTPATMAGELRVEAVELRLAADYQGLLEPDQSGELPTKVRSLRKVIATELGFVVPLVAIRIDVLLHPGEYRISVHGVQAASGTTVAGAMLAIGQGAEQLDGDHTADPVFGLPATVIAPSARAKALLAGATVLDRTSLVVTHLGEVIRSHAPELLSLQQVKLLMDVVRQTDPAVIDELTGAQATAGDVLRTCRGLLAEKVPVRNFVRILEALAEQARASKSPEQLLEAARTVLGAAICETWAGDGRLAVIVFSPRTEALLAASVVQTEAGTALSASPEVLAQVAGQAQAITRNVEDEGRRAVLVCAPRLRPSVRRLLAQRVPSLGVLSVAELAPGVKVDQAGVIETAVPELSQAVA
jgi:flagellar biosynthesis protein FlhA